MNIIQLPLPFDIPGKKCWACQTLKPLAEFGYSRNECKLCKRARSRAYYQANRDRTIKRTNEYQKQHPEVQKKAKKRYKEKHPDRYALGNRSYAKNWRERNRERDRQNAKDWRKKNPDSYRAIQHQARSTRREISGSFTAKEWQELKAHYSYRCLCCERSEPEIVLCIDHVIPISRGGTNDISNIQPLCKSCNSAKGIQDTDYRY